MAAQPSAIDALQLVPATAALQTVLAVLDLRPQAGVSESVSTVVASILRDAASLAASLSVAEKDWRCEGAYTPSQAADVVSILQSIGAADSRQSYAGALRGAASAASVRVPLALLRPPAASASGLGRDTTEHQASRDVERDAFIVNGYKLPGASAGFDGVLATLVAVMRSVEDRAFRTSQTLFSSEAPSEPGEQQLERALVARARAVSLALLKRGNRTVSGGDAYEAATRVFIPRSDDGAFTTAVRAWESTASQGTVGGSTAAKDVSSVAEQAGGARPTAGSAPPPTTTPPLPVLLVADSKAAPPIEITVDVGAYQPHAAAPGGATPLAAHDAAAAGPSVGVQAPAAEGSSSGGSSSSAASVNPPLVEREAALARLGITPGDAALLQSCAGWRVGLRATVRAVTVYRLLLDDDPGGHAAAAGPGLLGRVVATYTQRLAWAPDLLAAPVLAEELAARARRGSGGDGRRTDAHDALLSPEAVLDAVHRAGSLQREGVVWRHIDAVLAQAGRSDGGQGGSNAAGPVAAPSPDAAASASSVPLLPIVCGDGGHVELRVELETLYR